MSREAKVIRNSAILTLQYVFTNIVTIFVVGYIARKLGKQDYGVYSLAFAFPLIFEFVGSMGLRQLTIREIARDKDNAIAYLGKVVPGRAVLIVCMAVFIIASSFILNYETRIRYAIMIATGSAICEQLSRIILDVFQGVEEMGKVAFRDVTVRLFTASASIYVLLQGCGLYEICFVYLAGSFIGLMINIWLYSRRFEFPKMRFDYQFLRDSIREGSSYVLIGLAVALYANSDILLISKMTDSGSLGIYNASANLFSKLGFIADAVATAVFPALSELYWTNRDEANGIFNKALLSMLLLSLPLAIGGFILSAQIITLIYGSSYAESAKVFSILILSTPMIFLAMLLMSSLNAIKQQRFVARALSAAAVASLIFNFFFIHWMGYIGAAFASLIVKIFLFAMLVYGSRLFYKISLSANMVVSILISLLCLGGITYVARSFGLYITIPLAAVAYYACLRVSGQLKNVKLSGKLS